MSTAAVVLSTVNAPYSEQLTAQQLVYYLMNPFEATAVPGHMSSFFGEVKPNLQMQFASEFHIPVVNLVKAAKEFASYSGETYALAA